MNLPAADDSFVVSAPLRDQNTNDLSTWTITSLYDTEAAAR